MNKLESVISIKNLCCSGILSDNLCDEVGDLSDNLREIAEKVDPTHIGVVIYKHNIVVMTQNKGIMRGTPNIIIKKIKRCKGGDAIVTEVRKPTMFVKLTLLTYKLSK